ncbi:TetR/AcrR family transcriptional regulator [Rhodococcus sp. HNM0569]|uniref:TetR/AcrR family transcriptional regulator n=1 Tax=Rhodococcus sp. HNM0569 TaxID=2716340 RepID=UPI00146E7832|nr:TetR/AcrR family transcriptional regulator [Rhodococcus sp. HNM0569]NLU81243.1 helix-turn-helix transcriptional regulator [Rhodococcus sp. HNM0569]
MPRASAAAAAETARRILDSASDLFAANGFADISVDDVAREAGVTRGAVYHHYRNKQGLFGAVVARLQARIAADVVDAATAVDGPQEQLRAGSHAFLDAITAAPAVRVLLVDGPAVVGWRRWRELDARNSAAHLRDALRDAGVAESLVDATTAQLSGAMNEAALWIAQHREPAAAREQAHAVLDRILAAALP